MTKTYRVFVGIDWGTEAHQVWAIDRDGNPLGERRVPHRGAALVELADWLVALANGEASAVAVALEVPHGPVVDTLLERGCDVFAINPKQLNRFRDRYSTAGAKDDRRDAHVLSHAVRTDRVAFRALAIEHPLTLQLREHSRHDAELGEDLQRLANRLRDHLRRVWPELLALVPNADEPWFWAVLDVAPTPTAAQHLRPARLRQLLRDHRIRRVTAEQLLTVWQAPTVRLAAGVREGVAVRIADLIAQLRIVHAQRRQAERRLAETLDAMTAEGAAERPREQHDATILQSLPGLGTRIAATMLAEAARALRDRDYHAFRVLGGSAPVTKQSGKTRVVMMRYACHGRLQDALYWWAQGSVRDDPRSRALYAQLRQRGHDHARALRGVADRLLALLIAMLKTRTLFDPDRWTSRVMITT